MKKLSADIYAPKAYGDCSNKGISHFYDRVICYLLEGDETVQDIINPEPNAVVLVPRILWGEKHYYFEPVEPVKEGYVGYMYGGCIITSSDSRFQEYFEFEMIRLHDRQDDQDTYNAMSY